ncbi:erythromycin esterase family protein [Legionella israelensis]|uniref:Erythromycin esterase n=1 Tax=Legionella israelensis TaxID=454 RepID=A0A0W0W3Q4_9GAMM|nr:erythromycin esterase family protein [Legionella israelensis]KTD26929.1 erythromycin esterase [Legionella israelensis]QBS08592.1 erythromycin esterase family protein [Legionella israelensis]SCX75672.1 Erythromycin esterase homolog [Legionella israelensis DSM 19235]STX58247.1 erythromycin esterase [Legionella israelensis]
MNKEVYQKLMSLLNETVEPLQENGDKYASLLNKIGEARFVLMGEATHGTEEFYQARIEISQQLILKKGFMAIAIEGDWPDAYQIHRYIQNTNNKSVPDAKAALTGFTRFPRWMWRNITIPPFLEWLRKHNDHLSSISEKIGFYGLDLYSMNASMSAVIRYLETVDPQAAKHAKERYACFDTMSTEPQTYGYLTNLGIKKACIEEAIEQLMELQHRAADYLEQNGIEAEDKYFFALQNARLVKNAENYYRSMFEGHVSSWNIRDTHMAETVDILADHLEKRFNRPAKIILWAHNSHIGDARATEMGERGEVNLGQLIRERHDSNTYSIGFSTYEGTVAAARDWDEPVECKNIAPGLEGSYEALFHDVKHKNFILDCGHHKGLEHYLKIPRLQRAIGVIYRPETERLSHYFFSRLPYQFDGLIHFDHTNALQPLDVKKWAKDSENDKKRFGRV